MTAVSSSSIANMVSIDFLEFKDSKSYQDRIDAAVAKGGSKDAVICGEGKDRGNSGPDGGL